QYLPQRRFRRPGAPSETAENFRRRLAHGRILVLEQFGEGWDAERVLGSMLIKASATAIRTLASSSAKAVFRAGSAAFAFTPNWPRSTAAPARRRASLCLSVVRRDGTTSSSPTPQPTKYGDSSSMSVSTFVIL